VQSGHPDLSGYYGVAGSSGPDDERKDFDALREGLE